VAARIVPAMTVAWLIAAGSASRIVAEPVFAVNSGYSCAQCHVNRTGGGMRTPFGSIYGQTTLPSRELRWRKQDNLLPANPEARFAIGGDARFDYLYVESDDYEDTSSFEVLEANVYAEVRLIPRHLSLYVDQTLGPGGSFPRELAAIVPFRGLNGYVKVGKFLPPYGWRIQDDDAFIREPLGFAFSAPDVGIEVGIEPGRWSAHLAAVNGNAGTSDDNRSKKLTLVAMRRFRWLQVGVSGSYDDVTGGPTTSLAGILGGVNFGRLTLLGEADARRVRSDGLPDSDTWVGYVDANLMIVRGMNLKYSHDWTDPDRDVLTDRRQRDSLGFEYIPYPFVQVRAFVRRKDGPPQVPGSRDQQVDVELHLYF
jgi:hypothetical protein